MTKDAQDIEQSLSRISDLLVRVDATRASLPLILRTLAPSKDPTSLRLLQNAGVAQNRLSQFGDVVQNGHANVRQLRNELDASADVLNKVNESWKSSRADVRVDPNNRVRTNPFMLELTSSAASKASLRPQPFPVPSTSASTGQPDELVSEVGLSSALSAARTDDAQMRVTVHGVLHATLGLDAAGQVDVVACHGLSEASSLFQPSQHHLFERVSHACQSRMNQEGQRNVLELPEVLHMLAAYSSLFSDPCTHCKRLLLQDQLPTQRVYALPLEAPTSDGPSEARWLALHQDCLSELEP